MNFREFFEKLWMNIKKGFNKVGCFLYSILKYGGNTLVIVALAIIGIVTTTAILTQFTLQIWRTLQFAWLVLGPIVGPIVSYFVEFLVAIINLGIIIGIYGPDLCGEECLR